MNLNYDIGLRAAQKLAEAAKKLDDFDRSPEENASIARSRASEVTDLIGNPEDPDATSFIKAVAPVLGSKGNVGSRAAEMTAASKLKYLRDAKSGYAAPAYNHGMAKDYDQLNEMSHLTDSVVEGTADVPHFPSNPVDRIENTYLNMILNSELHDRQMDKSNRIDGGFFSNLANKLKTYKP